MKHVKRVILRQMQIAILTISMLICSGIGEVSVAADNEAINNTTATTSEVLSPISSSIYSVDGMYTLSDLSIVGPEAPEVVEEPIVINPYNMTYYESDKTEYITARSGLHIRSVPNYKDKSNVITTIGYGKSVTCKGDNGEWVEIIYNDSIAYAYKKYLSSQPTVTVANSNTGNSSWNGAVLTSRAGRVTGPSGVETYYNLNMSGCIRIMNSLGYYGDYWVRSDGAKMFGSYIMVAADLNKYPKGTIVNTSLGQGIVVDTGSFTHNGSDVTFDIATAW